MQFLVQFVCGIDTSMTNKRTIFSYLQLVTMAGFVWHRYCYVPVAIIDANTSVVLACCNAAALTE